MKYQCNNTFYRHDYTYNLGEIIDESDYNNLPAKYQRWFTEVGKPLHFFCQNLTGDEDFSIDEWNKAFNEVKDLSIAAQRLILDPPPACKEQCFACMAIVGERQRKTREQK